MYILADERSCRFELLEIIHKGFDIDLPSFAGGVQCFFGPVVSLIVTIPVIMPTLLNSFVLSKVGLASSLFLDLESFTGHAHAGRW